VFQSQNFSEFPTSPQRFTVYAALYGGEGKGRIKLIITHLETERDIHIKDEPVTLPGRRMIMNMMLPVDNVIFPAPGRHMLTLKFEGETIMTRLFDVFPK
jgi:hypothetical protein